MPKQQKEINIFNTGIVLNVDEKDIPENAASFSLNVNPNSQDGILSGIKTHRFITSVDGTHSRAILPCTFGYSGTDLNDLNSPRISSTQCVEDITVFENSNAAISFVGTKGYKETLICKYAVPHMERLVISQTHLGNSTTPSYGAFYADAAIGVNDTEFSLGNASSTADLENLLQIGEYIQFSTTTSFQNPDDYEIMKVLKLSGETVTVERGVFNSKRKSYATSTNYRIFINRISYNYKGPQTSTNIGYFFGDKWSGISGNHLKGNNAIAVSSGLKHVISGESTKVVFDADAKTMVISGTSTVEDNIFVGDSVTIYTTAHGDSNNHGSTFKVRAMSDQTFYFDTAPVTETVSSSTTMYFEPSLLKNSTFTHKSASSGVGDDQNYKVNDWYMTTRGANNAAIYANVVQVDDDTGAIVQATDGIYNDVNLFGSNISTSYYPYKANSPSLTLKSLYRYHTAGLGQVGVALTATDTRLTLGTNGITGMQFAKGDIIYIDDTADGSSPVEYMKVLSVDLNSIEIQRGLYGTEPSAHAADTYIYKNASYEINQDIDKDILKPDTEYELTFWSKLHTGAQATATWVALSSTSTDYDGGTISFMSANGTQKTYIFDDDNDGATGSIDGSGFIRVQLHGITVNPTNVADELREAIIDANGHNGELTASNSSGTLTITQASHGDPGNTQIRTTIKTNIAKFTEGGSTQTNPSFTAGNSSEGIFRLEVNGGYIDGNGEWNPFLNTEADVGYAHLIYKPSRYHTYNSFEDCVDLRSIPSTARNIIEYRKFRQLSFKFKTPKEKLNTDLKLSFGNIGSLNSVIAIANINLCEETTIYGITNQRGYIKSSGFINHNQLKDLVTYDPNNNLLRLIKNFNRDTVGIPEATVHSSPDTTMSAISTGKQVTFANKNKETHIGFGPKAEDNPPKWLGYINQKMFGSSFNDVYLDVDEIPLYDKGSSTNFNKICLAGEWECITAVWDNGNTTLEVDMGSGNTHGLTVGDNIIVREYMDTDNSWDGAGVWYVSALDNAAGDGATRYFRCRRNATLDDNPPDDGSMTDGDNNYKISFRPFYYYAMKRGDDFIYRITPETRIAGTSGDDFDSTYYKGFMEKCGRLDYNIESICCSYSKNGNNPDGGYIYALTSIGEIVRLNVNIAYNSWATTVPIQSETIKPTYRSFKWSNLRTDGNITASEYVFDSLASESSPVVSISGKPSDILETKGPTVTFDWNDADNKNADVAPTNFDTRLWIQAYPTESGGTFSDGDRFLFCGKTEYVTGENNLMFADRTPPTVTRYGRRNNWVQFPVYQGNQIPDHTVYLQLPSAPFIHENASDDEINGDLHPDISPSFVRARSLFSPEGTVSYGGNHIKKWRHIEDYDFNQGRPVAGGFDGDVPFPGQHPFVSWGYNVGWDGTGGKKSAIKVARYGLFQISDNTCDGTLDGTGVVVPNDDNTDKKYGELGRRMSAHAVGLIGSSEVPWIRNAGRMIGTDSYYVAARGSEGQREDPANTFAADTPALMDASKVVFVCTDMHFGDYPQKPKYSISSVAADSVNPGGAGAAYYTLITTTEDNYLQSGDLVYFEGTGTWPGWGNSYHVVALDSSNPRTKFYVNEASGSLGNDSGEVYIGGFTRNKILDGDNNNETWLSARGHPDNSEPYHFALNHTNKGDGAIFNEHGGFGRLWYTDQNNFGPGRLNGENYVNRNTDYPAIQNHTEQLNWQAGFMIRPFNMDDNGFDKLLIGDYLCIDMPCFPETILHKGTTIPSGEFLNARASKLFITTPGELNEQTNELEDSKVFVCEWNNTEPDRSSHQEIPGTIGHSSQTENTEYWDDWISSEFQTTIDEQSILFQGYVTTSSSYTGTAATAAGKQDATLHPVVELDMSELVTNMWSDGEDINPHNDFDFYREKNCLAGLYITFVTNNSNGNFMQTRKIVGSYSLGGDVDDNIYVSLNYPLYGSSSIDAAKFYVSKAAQLCTAPIHLIGETTTFGAYTGSSDIEDSSVYAQEGEISLSSSGTTATATTLSTTTYHNLTTNDVVNIQLSDNSVDGTSGYEGTYAITVTGNRTFTFTTPSDSSMPDVEQAKYIIPENAVTSSSNPIPIKMNRPIAKWVFGDLDMRKLKDWVVTETSSADSASDELRLTTSTGHLLDTGDMVTLNTEADNIAISGTYIIDDVGVYKFDITTPDNTNATGKTYALTTNQWCGLLAASTGDAFLSEMRFGLTKWDRGDKAGNLLRYDTTPETQADKYLSLTDSAVDITGGVAAETAGYFRKSKDYFYKVSMIYDGYQEGPLSMNSWTWNDRQSYDSLNVTVSLPIDISRRCTSVCLYRKDDVNSFYRLVKQIPTAQKWLVEDGKHKYKLNDGGNVYASYEARTGISESMIDLSVKYSLSCELDGYLFVGNCSHPQIDDCSNQIFRSKPGKWSIFDWSVDFNVLNSTPTAMVSFLGRLIVFDENNIYKINPQTLTIEDIFEGVGCSGPNSVVVTEYSMFFANRQGAYMYDGQKPVKISETIQSGGDSDMLSLSSSSTVGANEIIDLSWENTAGNTNAMAPHVTFDSKNNLVYFIVEFKTAESFSVGSYSGISTDDDYKLINKHSYIWSFSMSKSRWDLWELATDDENIGKPFIGKHGEVFISIGNGIYEIQGGQNKKLYTWMSKQLTMGISSIKKVFNKVKVVGPKDNLILDGEHLNDSDKLIISTDEGRITSGSNSTTSNIVYKSQGNDSADYKLKSSNKTAKWIQFKFEEMEEDVKSVGCIFRMRSIK